MRQETQYEEFHSDNLGLATKIHVVSNRFFSHTAERCVWLAAASLAPKHTLYRTNE